MNTYKVNFKFVRDVLGSQPADPALRQKYIVAKMVIGKMGMSAEVAMKKVEMEIDNMERDEDLMGTIKEIQDRGLTVFPRNKEGKASISDVQVRGFMKAAFAYVAIRDKLLKKRDKKGEDLGTYGEAWYRKWIGERISFVNQYAPIPENVAIDFYNRPISCMTMQGPRTSITGSERASAGFSLTFEIRVEEEVKKAWLEAIFDRGTFKGIGQWANAQYGTFEYLLEKQSS